MNFHNIHYVNEQNIKHNHTFYNFIIIDKGFQSLILGLLVAQ